MVMGLAVAPGLFPSTGLLASSFASVPDNNRQF